ncbi:DoxX family protein [Streptomyces sp. NBC_00009]|uniref:DoxX family protein n=1 Tax=Streptomyces sp. NBC_00009 TaxID=2975620 RepID=UPI0032524E2F
MLDSLVAKTVSPVLSLVRIVLGVLFACHGAASLFGVWGGAAGTHGATVPFDSWPDGWAAVIEIVCGGLVALGLFTRLAALVCSGSMAYAYFVVHLAAGLLPIENDGEPAALYAWAFLLVAALGSGPWALDRLLANERAPQAGALERQATVDA